VAWPTSRDWGGRNRAKRLQRPDESLSKEDERPQKDVPPRHAGDSPILLRYLNKLQICELADKYRLFIDN
jgi:hypothetical protein